jgi:hypothetical protein
LIVKLHRTVRSALVAGVTSILVGGSATVATAASGVDCIGDGASCQGQLNGAHGTAWVTGNRNPHAYWRFKLTCLYLGDQYSGDNPPSAGTVRSDLNCNGGSPATYWNVLIDWR